MCFTEDSNLDFLFTLITRRAMIRERCSTLELEKQVPVYRKVIANQLAVARKHL